MNCPRCGKGIDKHVAGRETDACVAEVVMGWTTSESLPETTQSGYYIVCCDVDWYWVDPDGKHKCSNDSAHGWIPPKFSTDIAAAWMVVEKMHELGFRTDLESGWENLHEYFAWKCKFYKPHYLETHHHETAPLAICLAALKACSEQL